MHGAPAPNRNFRSLLIAEVNHPVDPWLSYYGVRSARIDENRTPSPFPVILVIAGLYVPDVLSEHRAQWYGFGVAVVIIPGIPARATSSISAIIRSEVWRRCGGRKRFSSFLPHTWFIFGYLFRPHCLGLVVIPSAPGGFCTFLSLPCIAWRFPFHVASLSGYRNLRRLRERALSPVMIASSASNASRGLSSFSFSCRFSILIAFKICNRSSRSSDHLPRLVPTRGSTFWFHEVSGTVEISPFEFPKVFWYFAR